MYNIDRYVKNIELYILSNKINEIEQKLNNNDIRSIASNINSDVNLTINEIKNYLIENTNYNLYRKNNTELILDKLIDNNYYIINFEKIVDNKENIIKYLFTITIYDITLQNIDRVQPLQQPRKGGGKRQLKQYYTF